MRLLPCAFLVATLLPTDALAYRCDPLEILQKDTESVILQDEAALVYFKQRAAVSQRRAEGSGSITTLIGKAPVGLGISSASALSRQIKEVVGIDYSEKSQRHILRSTLSANALAAYQTCLAKDGIEIDVPEDAHTRSKFNFRVSWRQGPFSENVILSVSTTSGKLQLIGSDARQGQTSVEIKPGSKRSFEISGREIGQSTDITVVLKGRRTIGSDSETYTVPAYEPFQVQVKPKTSSLLKTTISWRHSGTRKQQICISPDQGWLFLPHTSAMEDVYINRTGESKITHKDPVRVCGENSVSGTRQRTTIHSRVYVQQFRIRKTETVSQAKNAF